VDAKTLRQAATIAALVDVLRKEGFTGVSSPGTFITTLKVQIYKWICVWTALNEQVTIFRISKWPRSLLELAEQRWKIFRCEAKFMFRQEK
jgi:hypothetical protein